MSSYVDVGDPRKHDNADGFRISYKTCKAELHSTRFGSVDPDLGKITSNQAQKTTRHLHPNGHVAQEK